MSVISNLSLVVDISPYLFSESLSVIDSVFFGIGVAVVNKP